MEALDAQRRAHAAECEEEEDAPEDADPATLRRDASNEELREFFARTPMFEPFSSNLDAVFAANIDVNKLLVLAQPSNEQGWTALTGVLFQGDTTAASLFKVILLSTPATGGVSASARPLKRERCSKRDPTRADDAAPRDDDDESDHRRLAKSKDFMVLHINVYDDKDTFINRQYYELKNANCNPGTFFKPKMALLASAKNPPALLAADYFICTPSQSAAVQIALGAAMGTAGLVGSVVLAFMVAVSVFLSKKCSKEKMIIFDDGDIEDELYELAYDKLMEQKKIDDAAKEAEKKQKEQEGATR